MDQSPYERAIGKDSFRILLLEPGRHKLQPLRCTLLPCNFSDNITYEAISYAWGHEKSKATISCNGISLEITQDLELCLKALRSESETRALWIDQVCINQNDLDEKSAQVSIMGAIYRSAARVVVWLGPGNSQSGQALSFMFELCQAFFAYYQHHGGEVQPFRGDDEVVRLEPTGFQLPVQKDPRWRALFDVLDRKWFSRYWVVQEVMANDNVIVQCGDDQSDWSVLRRLGEVISHYSALHVRLSYNDRVPAAPALLAALGGAENWRTNHQAKSTLAFDIGDTNSLQSFSSLIHIFSRQSVKLDCDRIYSLLGIAASPVAQHITVDYRLSTSQVYMDFAVKSMKQSCNLDHLNFVEYAEDKTLEGLPSWVPDWTNAPKTKSRGIKLMDFDLFRACGSQPTHEPFRVSGKKLLVRARMIDVIESQRMDFTPRTADLAGKDVGFDELLSCKEEEVDFYDRVENTIETCQPYSTGESTMTIMCRLLFRDWLWSPLHDGPPIGDFQKAFREQREHTRYLRKFFQKFEVWGDSMAMKGWMLQHPQPATDRCDRASFITAIAKQLCGNAIIKSRQGFMANVPQQAKTGDVLTILNGCKTPLVLRQREPDGYILIGDCYVHGIMYGEAMEMGFDETEIALI